jgi:hypothetical protein
MICSQCAAARDVAHGGALSYQTTKRRRASVRRQPHTAGMTARRTLKPKAKTQPSPPPERPPKALASDPSAETISAINQAVISINGALNTATATLRRRIDARFNKLERLLTSGRRPQP